MKQRLIFWIIDRALRGKMQKVMKTKITETYRILAADRLKVKTDAVKVKKGKRKYTLLFFETNKGKTIVNIGRHTDNTLPKEIRL
jgi:hypothetical protein